jgi:sulfite reductase (NADPH) flavoprotein alpha-component
MVADVENTIVQLIEQQSGRSPEEARQYLEQMKIDRRYMKDVY